MAPPWELGRGDLTLAHEQHRLRLLPEQPGSGWGCSRGSCSSSADARAAAAAEQAGEAATEWAGLRRLEERLQKRGHQAPDWVGQTQGPGHAFSDE